MSNQFKSFFSGLFGVLLAGYIYFLYCLYQDHQWLKDNRRWLVQVRKNIEAQQVVQQRNPQPPQVMPSENPKEVPKK